MSLEDGLERAFLRDNDDSAPGSSFDWSGLVSIDFWDRAFLLWLVDDSAAGSVLVAVTGCVRLCSRDGGAVSVGSCFCSFCIFSSSCSSASVGELPRFSGGKSDEEEEEEDDEQEEEDDDDDDEEEEEEEDDDAIVKNSECGVWLVFCIQPVVGTDGQRLKLSNIPVLNFSGLITGIYTTKSIAYRLLNGVPWDFLPKSPCCKLISKNPSHPYISSSFVLYGPTVPSTVVPLPRYASWRVSDCPLKQGHLYK